ncbi:MAG: hypothetical protein AAF215_15950 [Cyanobacteria bacterium P01_A01_bin.123]
MSLLPLLFAIAILVGVYFWFNRRQRSPLRGYSLPQLSKPKVNGVDGRTRRALMRLVNGNPGVAQRLVERVRQQNPERSEQWCWEKAIYDIQRDRRA